MRDVTDALWLGNNPYSVVFWCIRRTMSTVKHCETKLRCIYIQTCCTHDSTKLKGTDSYFRTVAWNSGVNFTTEI
jgi:hypothetical protein